MSVSMEWQPKFTIEEIHAFSDEQIRNMNIEDMVDARLVADEEGDTDLAMKIFSMMPLAPESLIAAKATFGADWIREHKLNTSRADEKYGTNWLDS